MPRKIKIQAYIPAGAEAIDNKLGTAPGIRAEYKRQTVFCFAGRALEMKQMFEDSVLARAAENSAADRP